MHYYETPGSVEQLDHFRKAHLVQSEAEEVDNDPFGQNSLGQGVVELFGRVEQDHVLASEHFLRGPHLYLEVSLYDLPGAVGAGSSD